MTSFETSRFSARVQDNVNDCSKAYMQCMAFQALAQNAVFAQVYKPMSSVQPAAVMVVRPAAHYRPGFISL